MRILAQCTSSNEYDNADFDYAIIELDLETRIKLTHYSRVSSMMGRDEDFNYNSFKAGEYIQFYCGKAVENEDYTLRFVTHFPELVEQLEKEGFCILPNSFEVTPGYMHSAEVPSINIYPDKMCWTTFPVNHTFKISTIEIPTKILQSLQ